MVEYNGSLDNVFKAIADPVRRQILSALREGPATVGQIAAPHDMTFAGAAKHVNALVDAGLVHKTRMGRQQLCRLNAAPMQAVHAWLQTYSVFWEHRLDALERAVREFEDES